MIILRQGTLRETVRLATKQALAAGALIPIPTDQAVIEERGVRFLVRVLAALRRKDAARQEQADAERTGKKADPFLPPETALTVAELTDSHLAVLNKFNVVDEHLLVITRRFEEQESLLTLQDFEALLLCMAEYDGLGFYNGGKEGGASQEHKHLQFVPLPLSDSGPAVPIEPLLGTIAGARGTVGEVPAFSFRNAFCRFDPELLRSPAAAAERAFLLYGDLLRHVGMKPPQLGLPARQTLPYCLLITRRWMLLVPRSREHVQGVSLNSLAYAGSFFVRDEQELAMLRSRGPFRALTEAALPK